MLFAAACQTTKTKTVTSIAIKQNPTKITYTVDDTAIALAGGKITVNYSDDTSEDLDMTADGVTVTGFSTAQTGEVTITVSFQSKSDTFKITVNAAAPAVTNAELVQAFADMADELINPTGDYLVFSEEEGDKKGMDVALSSWKDYDFHDNCEDHKGVHRKGGSKLTGITNGALDADSFDYVSPFLSKIEMAKNFISTETAFSIGQDYKGAVNMQSQFQGYIIATDYTCRVTYIQGKLILYVNAVSYDNPMPGYSEYSFDYHISYRLTMDYAFFTGVISGWKAEYMEFMTETYADPDNTEHSYTSENGMYWVVSSNQVQSNFVKGSFGYHEDYAFDNATIGQLGGTAGSRFVVYVSKNGDGEIENYDEVLNINGTDIKRGEYLESFAAAIEELVTDMPNISNAVNSSAMNAAINNAYFGKYAGTYAFAQYNPKNTQPDGTSNPIFCLDANGDYILLDWTDLHTVDGDGNMSSDVNNYYEITINSDGTGTVKMYNGQYLVTPLVETFKFYVLEQFGVPYLLPLQLAEDAVAFTSLPSYYQRFEMIIDQNDNILGFCFGGDAYAKIA